MFGVPSDPIYSFVARGDVEMLETRSSAGTSTTASESLKVNNLFRGLKVDLLHIFEVAARSGVARDGRLVNGRCRTHVPPPFCRRTAAPPDRGAWSVSRALWPPGSWSVKLRVEITKQ